MFTKTSSFNTAEIIGAALLFGMSTVFADNLSVPEYDIPTHPDTPIPGSYMQDVIAELGEPAKKSDAVGMPPISRWDYNDFRVYFEHDRVIHSVVR